MSMTGVSRMRQRGTTGDDDHRGSNGDESTMRRRNNYQQGRRPRLAASSQQQQENRGRRDVVEDDKDDFNGSHDDDDNDDDDDGSHDDLGEGSDDDDDDGRDVHSGNNDRRGDMSNNSRALRNGAASHTDKADRNVGRLAVDNDQVAPTPHNNHANNKSVVGHTNYASSNNGSSNGNDNNGVLPTNNQTNNYGGHANYGYSHYNSNAVGDAAEMALNQKNQRLAKELVGCHFAFIEQGDRCSLLVFPSLDYLVKR